ncbi:uncharacterized protein BDV17DRAFT_289422 [Aspergillus undulatus]|uniref:uncharacterized protein n=1 Tax=Aspergillus undulatus TaxID=1810928 RepID=UPI003CCDC8BD
METTPHASHVRETKKVAINYEERTERNPLLGDTHETREHGVRSALPEGQRDLMQEAEYEYGARVGIWRLLRTFEGFNVPYSIFLSSEALTMNSAKTQRRGVALEEEQVVLA